MALYDEDGDIFVYSTDQSAHQTLHECSLLLGTDRVKVQNALVGGGFGGKEDMTVQHLAALLTYATKKPVKMKLTRAESLLVHPKRHPFYMAVLCWNVHVLMRQVPIIMRISRLKELLIIPTIRLPERFAVLV